MPRMPHGDFSMTVSDIFVLSGRGVVASGQAGKGEFRSGRTAQIWHGDRLLGTSMAYVEMHVRPGMVALLLTDPTVSVQPGHVITSSPR